MRELPAETVVFLAASCRWYWWAAPLARHVTSLLVSIWTYGDSVVFRNDISTAILAVRFQHLIGLDRQQQIGVRLVPIRPE
jgi:hypothetical protein